MLIALDFWKLPYLLGLEARPPPESLSRFPCQGGAEGAAPQAVFMAQPWLGNRTAAVERSIPDLKLQKLWRFGAVAGHPGSGELATAAGALPSGGQGAKRQI